VFWQLLFDCNQKNKTEKKATGMQENPGGSSSNAAETNRLHNKNAIV
jgi:hypothetical protein